MAFSEAAASAAASEALRQWGGHTAVGTFPPSEPLFEISYFERTWALGSVQRDFGR